MSVINQKSSFHQDRKPETDDIDNDIAEWILINISLWVSISPWQVIIKICSLNQDLKLKVSEHSKNGAISS